jgi:hypothetical protein
VYSVTSAPPSLQSDKSERMRRYLFSMSVRTLCFVLAIFLTGPARWVCIVLACILPYVAVVMANAVRGRQGDSPSSVPPVSSVPSVLSGPGVAAPPVYLSAPRALPAPDEPYAR